jgi:hypothetical protein
MVTGSARAVMLIGLLLGLTLLGGVIGAGVDYAAGNQGWWAVLGLVGLVAGASIDAIAVDGRRRVRPARPATTAEPRLR